MFDRTMPDVHLEMRLPRLGDIPAAALPEGFRIRAYRPCEETAWSEIETAAGEFAAVEGAMRGFDIYFRTDELLLPQRMLFAVDAHDRPVATATAWFHGDAGMLHWVAVHGAFQGRGLARPVIAAALGRLRDLGYTSVGLGTQPPSWVAIRLYLEFGFLPVRKDDPAVIAGWEAVYHKLGREFSSEKCVESL